MVGKARFDLLYDFAGPSPAVVAEGLHHLAVKVDDLPAAMRHFRKFKTECLAQWSDEKALFLPPNVMYGCLWRVLQG